MHFSDDLPGICQEPRSTSYGMPSEQRLAQGAKETGWHSYYYCDPVEYEVKASKHAVRRGAAQGEILLFSRTLPLLRIHTPYST